MVDTDAGDPRVPVERAMSAPGWALEVSVGTLQGAVWHFCCMWTRALECYCMLCELPEPPHRGGSTNMSMSAWLCRSVE